MTTFIIILTIGVLLLSAATAVMALLRRELPAGSLEVASWVTALALFVANRRRQFVHGWEGIVTPPGYSSVSFLRQLLTQ